MSAQLGFWLERFDAYLATERRLAWLTRQHYRRDLEMLAGYCNDLGLAGWEQVNSDHIRRFLALRHPQGLAGRSLQRALSSIRALYRYLIREGAAGYDPANGVQAPKIKRRLPEVLMWMRWHACWMGCRHRNRCWCAM